MPQVNLNTDDNIIMIFENFEKLERFANVLEAEQLQELIRSECDCEANRINRRVTIKPGRRYAKVDVGSSGKYMVDNVTGEIFGIKAYGQVHKGNRYGTLDTIDQYYWGHYTARRLSEATAPYVATPSEAGVRVTPATFAQLQADLTVSDTTVQWRGCEVVLYDEADVNILAVFTADQNIVSKIKSWCVKNTYRCSAVCDDKVWL